MSLFLLDAYAHLQSPMHRWDARYKLIGLLAIMVAMAAVNDVRLLPPMLLLAAGCFALSRLPLRYLLGRLRYPGFFVVAVLLLVPLLAGSSVLVQVGPVAVYREGLLLALLIGARFVSILTVSIVLFGSQPFLTTVQAMHALGLPALLTDMILFFYRYLSDIAAMLERMQRALWLRGFQGHRLRRTTLPTYAALAGSLLIRSYTQSERVYQAMRLRGYGSTARPRTGFTATRTDALALAVALLCAAGLFATTVVL